MPTYLTPGVYVEEMQTGARPIQPVGTSTAAFLGVASLADAHAGEAIAVNNWTQFQKLYVPKDGKATPLVQAVYGFFVNGGSRCYVINLGTGGTLAKGLRTLEQVDEVAIVAAPGYADPASHDALLGHCELMKDRVAVLDGPEKVDSIDRFTVVGAAGETDADAPKGVRPRPSDGGYGAVYWPWITVKDALDGETLVTVPPSGHMAGIYARTDATRGVHKAPANEIIRGALNVGYRLTPQEQGVLNPVGVNCIRFFTGQGIRVWGARTVADGSSEWRYLNVRRVFNFMEKSIARSTNWIVFEPNDQFLWQAIRRDITSFLTVLWREGMLAGKTADEAFFVKCDSETNTPETIELGQVITLIGVAVVKPAEFIIFRIGQHAGGTSIEEG
jgi:phage tail sheath protein FI